MIVKMCKLRLIGLLSERNAVVRRLMKLGVTQLAPLEMSEEEKEAAAKLTVVDDATTRINEIEEELRKIRSAIAFLETKLNGKKPPKKSMSYETFVNQDTYKGAWEKVFNANDIYSKINGIKSEINNLNNLTARLEKWQSLSLPVEIEGTAETFVLQGTFPAAAEISKLEQEKLLEVSTINEDKDYKYVTVIAHKQIREQAMQLLADAGFTKADLGIKKGLVAKNIETMGKEVITLTDKLNALQAQGESMADNHLATIYNLHDYISNMQERRRVRGNIIKTSSAFFVGGWLPRDSKQLVTDALKDFTVAIEFVDVAKGEETPVLLRNNKFVYPFEIITEMYSLPKSTTLDPDWLMTPFFIIFFGMMLSDAGYGIALILICGYAMLKMKLTGMADKLIRLGFICGFSTLFFGALFGGWFGNLLPAAFGLNVKPLWFDPIADPMRLLFVSLGLGGAHIAVGMAIKAYMLIRDGDVWAAIFDVGFWYMVLGGLTMFLLGVPVGQYVAIAGVVGLILTQGRHNKNIFGKLFGGIMSLYDITGYLSDILSYARLLALGLATGVIGTVFNTMGMMGGGFTNIVGAILLIVVVIVGHGFNLAINVLGTYVHASRLQYIEFYGKFYETGGVPFKPLQAKTKYVNIE